MAGDRRATGVPFWLKRTCGFLPDLPITMTLLTDDEVLVPPSVHR
jgi:hypothetical protein